MADKKLKSKKKFKEAFGTNPWEPWSAKAGLAESSAGQLLAYLKSRGFDPRYVTKDQKIAYSKTNEFKTWMNNNPNTELKIEDVQEQSDVLKIKPTGKAFHHSKYLKRATTVGSEIKTPRGPGHHSEEVEQLDELSPKTLGSYIKKASADKAYHANVSGFEAGSKEGQRRASGKLPQGNISEPGHIEKKRETGIATAVKKLTGESILIDDPKGTLTKVSERKTEMSKSARLIKSLYKHHKMVKEDLYDAEKDDKNPAKVYGKGQKLEKLDDKKTKDDGKMKAAATLSGGTTLTGQGRDTIELDPMVKQRSAHDDLGKNKKQEKPE